jgi:hypothetical protein
MPMSAKSLLKILLGVNPIAFIHLAQLRPKLFLDACTSAFAAALHSPTGIPEIHLGEILGDRRPTVRLSAMRYEVGTLPAHEIMPLLAILVAESPKEVLEIGTFMGHTTRQMAENLETATIHTVDLPEDYSKQLDSRQDIAEKDRHLIAGRTVGREYKGQPCASRIKQHFADTAKWDFREAGNPTFFFIDGAHSYEYCKSDSEKCFELCKGRGVFLWHDVEWAHPGVIQFLTEWRQKGRDIRRISGTPIAYWKSM